MQSEQSPKNRSHSSVSFLDSTQAADYLGLKKATLDAWRCRGGGPNYLKIGRYVRYLPEDLERWLESRKRSSTADDGRGR